MEETIGMQGNFRIENTRTGEVREVENTIVTVGKAQMAGLCVADVSAGSQFDWMSIGIGSETITAGDTTLGSEYLKYGLGSITGDRTTTTVTNDTARWIGSFGIDATKTINEAGLFNQSGLDTGVMLARTCYADISAGSGDTLNATWTVKFA